ncbi:phosphotransacetylase family protein [Halobacteriales archaeon Cl-PHB]
MNTILVTSTEEGTGKTAISIALARLAQDRDGSVGYMKPKGTRLRSAVGKTRDDDPLLAKELLGIDAALHELEPVVYTPTFVEGVLRGQETPEELRDRVADAFEDLSLDRDLMVVEGGGDLYTGGLVDLDDADVADVLDATVVLVARYSEPRDVDDVLAAADRLGDRLGGVLFNVVPETAMDELVEDVMPFLDGKGIPTLGAIPRDVSLAGVTIDELADNLGAQVLAGESGTDATVERFGVGAMSADAALEQFRRLRNAVVVTGGDRSDVQTAALEASGVKCLVLTGGFRPPGTVVGTADKRGVPVLLVQSNTRTTVDRIEDVLRTGRTRNEASVDRMADLLSESIDLDVLLGDFGE